MDIIDNTFQKIELSNELLIKKNVTLTIARLDLIDPIVSGNKLFKLYYFIKDAIEKRKEIIITKGGPYSNHLLATARYCQLSTLQCIGLIRGERPAILSHTLTQCESLGMKLIFLSRNDYDNPFNNELVFKQETEAYYFIPEGGFHPLGAKGASLIMEQMKEKKFSHVCTALGTATTLAGLLQGADDHQSILGIPVLKGMTDIDYRLQHLLETTNFKKPIIIDHYHFNGYAKYDNQLLNFMNQFYLDYNIATDFVYTGKLFFAINELILNDYFPSGSRICCIHTGGIQGNLSLSKSSLVF